MAEKPIGKDVEHWSRDYSTYFWSSTPPFEMKFEIEKITKVLLARDAAQTAKLTYSGYGNPPFIGREVQLGFEAALPKGNWYSFRLDAWVPCTWQTEAEFRRYADQTFASWIHSLQTAPSLGLLDSASQELYDQRVSEALGEEARLAGQKEDPAPILALKQEILAELRRGKTFRTISSEGGTIINFEGGTFVRSQYGETESREVLGSEDEALSSIRQLYDWESRKDSYPHSPPDLQVWKFIQGQLT